MRQFSNACVAHEKVSAPGRSRLQLAAALLCVAVCSSSNFARADDGGVSFWVPGFFGSLAATPQQPGFSLALIYYHSSVSAGGDVAFARQVNRGVSMLIPYGRVRANVDATLTGAVGPFGFTVSGSREDAVTGFGDLAPMFNVRWNAGVHNFMTYITGNLTTGRYDPTRLANLGIGHNAIDAGGAYTYFNPQTRHEFSATLGFTYNFENVHTDYQNGIDMHLDVGASQVLTKQLQVGLVGYWYNQLSCDTGTGDRVGCFESRVAGIHHPDQPGIPRLHQPERL